jgi:hypothetical protein
MNEEKLYQNGKLDVAFIVGWLKHQYKIFLNEQGEIEIRGRYHTKGDFFIGVLISRLFDNLNEECKTSYIREVIDFLKHGETLQVSRGDER